MAEVEGHVDLVVVVIIFETFVEAVDIWVVREHERMNWCDG